MNAIGTFGEVAGLLDSADIKLHTNPMLCAVGVFDSPYDNKKNALAVPADTKRHGFIIIGPRERKFGVNTDNVLCKLYASRWTYYPPEIVKESIVRHPFIQATYRVRLQCPANDFTRTAYVDEVTHLGSKQLKEKYAKCPNCGAEVTVTRLNTVAHDDSTVMNADPVISSEFRSLFTARIRTCWESSSSDVKPLTLPRLWAVYDNASDCPDPTWTPSDPLATEILNRLRQTHKVNGKPMPRGMLPYKLAAAYHSKVNPISKAHIRCVMLERPGLQVGWLPTEEYDDPVAKHGYSRHFWPKRVSESGYL